MHATLVPRHRAVLVFLRSRLSSSSQKTDAVVHVRLLPGPWTSCQVFGHNHGWVGRRAACKVGLLKNHVREMSIIIFPWPLGVCLERMKNVFLSCYISLMLLLINPGTCCLPAQFAKDQRLLVWGLPPCRHWNQVCFERHIKHILILSNLKEIHCFINVCWFNLFFILMCCILG